MNVFCGKLRFVFCMTQFVPPAAKPGNISLTDSQFGASRLSIDADPVRDRRKCSFLNRSEPVCHGRLPVVAKSSARYARFRFVHEPRIQNCKSQILIDSAAIRIRRKPRRFNKISISNRQRSAGFREPDVRHLRPETWFSNRNSKELKTHATL